MEPYQRDRALQDMLEAWGVPLTEEAKGELAVYQQELNQLHNRYHQIYNDCFVELAGEGGLDALCRVYQLPVAHRSVEEKRQALSTYLQCRHLGRKDTVEGVLSACGVTATITEQDGLVSCRITALGGMEAERAKKFCQRLLPTQALISVL